MQVSQMFMPLAQAGLVKPEKVIEFMLDNAGVENPRSWLAPQVMQLPPEAVALAAEQFGIPGEAMVEAATAAVEAMEEEQAEQAALAGPESDPSEG
jgi:hypothetical protein